MAKNSGDKQKVLQEKYMEFQVFGARIKRLREQLELMDQQCMELNLVIMSLEEFKQVKPCSEILVPVNNGIFARAELKDADRLIVNVGSEVCVAKTVEETKALLEGRLQEMVDERNNVALQLQEFGKRAMALEREVTTLASEAE